jgi:hypothetical protein
MTDYPWSNIFYVDCDTTSDGSFTAAVKLHCPPAPVYRTYWCGKRAMTEEQAKCYAWLRAK